MWLKTFMFILQIQFPVGQGGLHLTQLRSRAQRPINIVYDCGSKNGACALREPLRLMSGLIASRYSKADRPIIDVVVLSHLHADHVNGFETLVEEMRPTIDRLIMPYYDDDQILIILAMAAYQGANYQELANLNEALSNPARWFGERGVRQIIALVPRDPEADPPVRAIPPLPAEGPPAGFVLLRGPDRRVETGRPSIEAYVAEEDREARESRAIFVKVLRSVTLRATFDPYSYINEVFVIIPYCKQIDPCRFPRLQREQLRHAVKEILSPYRQGESLRFTTSKEGKRVVESLRRVYQKYVPKAARNLNETSIVCYIGKDRFAPSFCTFDCPYLWRYMGLFETPWLALNLCCQLELVSGWIMTGDAVLGRDGDWATLFGHRIRLPLFFQAPHHGAKVNFPRRIPPRTLCMFATCNEDDPHHPHPRIKARLAKNHIPLFEVGTQRCLASFGWLR